MNKIGKSRKTKSDTQEKTATQWLESVFQFLKHSLIFRARVTFPQITPMQCSLRYGLEHCVVSIFRRIAWPAQQFQPGRNKGRFQHCRPVYSTFLLVNFKLLGSRNLCIKTICQPISLSESTMPINVIRKKRQYIITIFIFN